MGKNQVTVYKGAYGRMFYVGEDAEVVKQTAHEAFNRPVRVTDCYVVGDEMYFEKPDVPGWCKMYAAYNYTGKEF